MTERIDRERMAIGKALGLKQWTLEEESKIAQEKIRELTEK